MASIAETANEPPKHTSIFRPFPVPQTGRQWFYLLFMQGFGAGLIDFGANFAIAYGMYGRPSQHKPVTMWVFSQNTVAGDMGVTCIIQCLVSMLITSTFVHTDLHEKTIQPLPFVYPHVEHLPDPRILFDKVFNRKELKKRQEEAALNGEVLDEKAVEQQKQQGGFKYYFWMLVRFIFEGTEMNMLAEKVGVRKWILRFIWTAAQGAAIGIVFGLPIWLLGIIIVAPIYKGGDMGKKWAPQVIKGIFACVLGWVTNPVMASLALGSQADHHLIIVPADEEASIAGEPTATSISPAIETIAEEAEFEAPPSPIFLTPYRVASTGHSMPTRIRASSVSSTTGSRGRSGSVSVTPRPPLTANVSSMSIRSVEVLASPRRPRGVTVSSQLSSTGSIPGTPRTEGLSPTAQTAGLATPQSYTYALGGTGGRAKRRPRAKTTSGVPPPMAFQPRVQANIVAPSGSTQPSTPSRSGLLDAQVTRPTRLRAASDVAGGAAHLPASQTPRQDVDRVGRAADDSSLPRLTLNPAATEEGDFDVFGRTDAAIPSVTVQRPSTDIRRSMEVSPTDKTDV